MTPRLGIIGEPVAHSLSPQIFAHLFRAAKLAARYDVWPTPARELSARLETMRRDAAIVGANVTIPHKEAVLPLMDSLHPSAREVGAVNCIRVRRMGGARARLEGHNTDVAGLDACLSRISAPTARGRGATMVILGAGGAARAAAAAGLRRKTWQIRICARNLPQARALARAHARLTAVAWAERMSALATCDILVNASAGGMEGMAALEIDAAALPLGAAVMDLVYRPLATPLLRAASARGLVTMDGLYMLVFQALDNYRIWFPADAHADMTARFFPPLYRLCRQTLTAAAAPPC